MELLRMLTDQQPPSPTKERTNVSQTVETEAVLSPERQTLPQTWKPTKGEWLVMVTLSISSFLTALDASILVAVLPVFAMKIFKNCSNSKQVLASALHGTTIEAFWAGSSYLLANAVSQPFLAALSDLFGRQQVLLPSISLFTIGSIICGAAPSFSVLLGGRVVKGIGGGGMMTLAQLVFADIVPLRVRPRYFTIVLGAWALGIMLGPVIGGAFAQNVSWRWCFYINLPFCAPALFMAARFVKLVPTEQRTYKEKIRSMDWTGSSLFAAGVTIFLFAVTSAGVSHPWSSWRTIVPLAIGVVAITFSLVYEHYWAKNPFLPHSLFQNASSIINYLAALFQGFLLYANLYYLTFYLSATHLVGPMRAGVDLLPALVFCMVSSPVTSALITRFGTYRWAVWLGYLLTSLGSGVTILLNEHSSQLVYSAIFATIGLGLGIILSAVNFATQASVTNTSDSGRAGAMYAFMRGVGMCVGVAIGGTIFVNAMKVELQKLGLPTSIAEQAEGYVEEVLAHLPTEDPLRGMILQAYAMGFTGVFIGLTAISASTLVLTLTIKQFSMDKVLESRYSVVMAERSTTTTTTAITSPTDGHDRAAVAAVDPSTRTVDMI
jgi:MFS family permease